MRLRITFVVAALALAVGVTAAWAGFPHFKSADSTFEEGTTTKGGGKNSTTLAAGSTDLSATAEATATTTTNSKFIVTWDGVAFQVGDTVHARLQGLVKWACINNGTNIPADGNTSKSPAAPLALDGVDGVETVARNGRAKGTVEIEIIAPTAAAAGLTCQGTQYVGLFALQLDVPIQISATSGDFTSTPQPVPYPSAADADGKWRYCREPGSAACFSVGD